MTKNPANKATKDVILSDMNEAKKSGEILSNFLLFPFLIILHFLHDMYVKWEGNGSSVLRLWHGLLWKSSRCRSEVALGLGVSPTAPVAVWTWFWNFPSLRASMAWPTG